MPIPRNSQPANAKRRIALIQSASTRRASRAPTPNASGIVQSVYPEYSIGGWIIIVGNRSRGSSPAPSTGAGFVVANGFA